MFYNIDKAKFAEAVYSAQQSPNQEPIEIGDLKDQFSDIEMLTKLFTAFNLLGEVLSHDSPFTSELLPACTERFLQQANYKLAQLQYKIQYQAEQQL